MTCRVPPKGAEWPPLPILSAPAAEGSADRNAPFWGDDARLSPAVGIHVTPGGKF